jgi:hypothetical protein
MESNPGKRRRRRGPANTQRELTVEQRARRTLNELRGLCRALSLRQGVPPDDADLEALVIPARAALTAELSDDDVAGLITALDQRLGDALKSRVAFRIGRVYCFLCSSVECVHAAPSDPRETFCGYRPTGKPEWRTFTNLCIARQEPRVDRLFGGNPEIIALVQTAEELTDGLLPGFGQGSAVFNMLGQVVVGLVPENLDPTRPGDERVALTLQVVEVGGAARRRLRLNILGMSTEAIAEAAADSEARGPAESLRRTVRATRERVESEGRRLADAEKRGAVYPAAERIGPLLAGVRGDLERCFRPARRRTRHAQERHEGGERPTSMAMSDARSAPSDRFLVDLEKDTVIILGPKGRAHVFSKAGKHVTSLQIRPGEVENKLSRRRWRSMRRGDVDAFRDCLDAADDH